VGQAHDQVGRCKSNSNKLQLHVSFDSLRMHAAGSIMQQLLRPNLPRTIFMRMGYALWAIQFLKGLRGASCPGAFRP
jgi:hypothetical protein